MRKSIAWAVGCLVLTSFFTGCAIHSVDVQTLTIPPQKDSTTVTVKGTATCTDYFLFYRVVEHLDVKSSNGQTAQRITQ